MHDAQHIIKKYKMEFPMTVLGDPLMHKISNELNVIPNIIRGRITDSSAWLTVELEGTEDDITKALDYLVEKGVSINSTVE